MRLWMVYNLHDYNKNKTYYDMHVEKGIHYNMDIQLILIEYLSFGVQNNNLYVIYKNKPIDLPDGVIMRSRYSLLSKQLEMMNIPVFNNSFVCDICNNKAKTYQLISEIGIDIVDSEFILGDITSINNYPNKEMVIKSVDGHGGSEVYLFEENNKLINHNYIKEYRINNVNNLSTDYVKVSQIKAKKDMVLQPLIIGENKDIRVYILDNQIIGAVLRKGNKSFKSNYSLGGEVNFYILNNNEKDIVYKIINLFKEKTTDYMVNGIFYGGIDFIIDENNKFIFNEIEDVVGSRMLYNTSDIDIVEEYLKSILKKY